LIIGMNEWASFFTCSIDLWTQVFRLPHLPLSCK
jgi:hypothetical protein